MIDLKFTVSEFGKITRTDLTPVISDSIGWYSATFTFHASWTEAKTALFKNGTAEAEVVLVNNTCVIPSTVLAERGDINVSVYCGERKTANVSKVQLTPSGYFNATPPAPPEPTQVAMYTFSDASGVRMFRYLDSKLEWYNGSVWTEVITDISGKLDKNFTAFTAETAITDTDQFPMNKTNGTLKKTAWSLIKSTLKTAHDLLYIPKLFNDLDSLTASELSGSAILPVNKSGLLNKISFNTLSSYLMEYSTHVSLATIAQTIKGAINELFTSVGDKLAKTTNITSIDDTGIADGEIMVANLTAKKIETSNKTIVTTLGTTDDTVPTSKAVKDVTDLRALKTWGAPFELTLLNGWTGNLYVRKNDLGIIEIYTTNLAVGTGVAGTIIATLPTTYASGSRYVVFSVYNSTSGAVSGFFIDTNRDLKNSTIHTTGYGIRFGHTYSV